MAVSAEKLIKVYKSKKSSDVCALRGVSFNLPDIGMVFILGKSGCGKSTLLNILGGLDCFDGGDVKIDGQSIKDFKERDLSIYRNNYVGFVFQENNLLEKESVKHNVELAFDLQGVKDTDGKVEAVLESVDIKGLAEKKCNCLSGGQKQRVAIARALVKQPKLLLCDEPTGALDSETGKEIFSLLKEVSKERLVMVVSHDRDSAEKYGDRVIELKDGEIISDSAPSAEPAPVNEPKKAEKHGGLRFIRALKTGASYIIARPIRMAICLLLCLITFTAVGTADVLNVYDRDEALLNSMEEIGYTYYSFGKSTVEKGSTTTTRENSYMTLDEADELSSILNVDRADYIYYFVRLGGGDGYVLPELGSVKFYMGFPSYSGIEGYVETDESFCDDYGFNLLAGRLPQNTGEVAIPLYLFNFFKAFGYNDGEKTTAVDSYDGLIGKTVSMRNMNLKENEVYKIPLTVTGILDTHYSFKKHEDTLFGKVPYDPRENFSDYMDDNTIDLMNNTLFVCDGFDDYILEIYNDFWYTGRPRVMRVIAPFTGSEKQKLENIRVYQTQYNGKVVRDGTCYNVLNCCTMAIESADGTLKTLSKYSLYVCLGLVAVSALFLIYYVSGTLNEKRREIGILRALGASRFDIVKIFACEYSIFTAFTIAVSSVLSVICSVILNGVLFAGSILDISFISFGIRQFAVIAAVAVLAVVAGIAFPLIKLLKSKPVDVIADRK